MFGRSREDSSLRESQGFQPRDSRVVFSAETQCVVSGFSPSGYLPLSQEPVYGRACGPCREAQNDGPTADHGTDHEGSRSDALGLGRSGGHRDHIGTAVVDYAP